MKESYTERIEKKRILWHIVLGIILSFAISMTVTFYTDDYHYMMPILLLFMEISIIIVCIRFVLGHYIVVEQKIRCIDESMGYAQKIE